MIRHSSSFLISILLHTFLLLTLFFVYKVIVKKQEIKKEKKLITVHLCTLSKEKKIQAQKVQAKKQKIKPKLTPKKPEVKKSQIKEVQTLTPLKKEVLVVNEEIKRTAKSLQEDLKPLEEKVEEVQEEITTRLDVESKEQRQSRLQQEYLDKNIQKIRELITNNLYYPRRARKRGITGKVMVKFTLLKDGNTDTISVVSSENEILSRAAVETIENISDKFPAPQQELILQVPIVYNLK